MQTMLFGRRVEYEEMGEGMPLVLIHGYPLNRTMWEPQLQGLADAAHMIALDLRGFGGSEIGDGDITISGYADDVRELLDSRSMNNPAVLCGLSMGGYVVFEYIRRYPNHVAGVILANTKAGADSPAARDGRDSSAALARSKGTGAIAEAMLPKMLAPTTFQNNPALVERVKQMMASASVPGIVGALTAMKERPDSTTTMLELGRPALVITGADDQLIPPSESETMARGLQDGRLVILPNAGHLSNLEQPELFNRAMKDYLKTVL